MRPTLVEVPEVDSLLADIGSFLMDEAAGCPIEWDHDPTCRPCEAWHLWGRLHAAAPEVVR